MTKILSKHIRFYTDVTCDKILRKDVRFVLMWHVTSDKNVEEACEIGTDVTKILNKHIRFILMTHVTNNLSKHIRFVLMTHVTKNLSKHIRCVLM